MVCQNDSPKKNKLSARDEDFFKHERILFTVWSCIRNVNQLQSTLLYNGTDMTRKSTHTSPETFAYHGGTCEKQTWPVVNAVTSKNPELWC
jgi:hypothetical protein